MGNIIFIGGVHGVGKTTFCSKLIERISKNLRHISASEIIKKYKNSTKEFVYKKVNNISNNQELLIEGLKKERENTDILLDGHFVLLDKEGNTQRIDLNTYKNIQIKSILLLVDEPENIKKRLNQRTLNNAFTIDLLKAMQSEEIDWAKEVANQLYLPIKIINLNQCKEYEDCLTESIKFISAYIND